VKVRIDLEVTPEQRIAIGGALGTWKAAPEEGVRYWAKERLAEALAAVMAPAGPADGQDAIPANLGTLG
jgi:hypothetical protein